MAADPDTCDVLHLEYKSGKWYTTFPTVVICDHGKPDGMTLCPPCEEVLWRAIADIPSLVADLELHQTKQNVFLERGLPQPDEDEDTEVIEESPLPYVESASKALRDLRQLFGPRPGRGAIDMLVDWHGTRRRPDLEEFAARLTRLTSKAFRIIDANPYLTHYGLCPTCQTDIRQERVPDGGKVECPDCGYSAEVREHLRSQLDIAADRRMTLTQVVKVLNDAGEPTSRQEIENQIYREGLPREELPVWQQGRLVKVWHYRLGDVRDWLARKKRRKVA